MITRFKGVLLKGVFRRSVFGTYLVKNIVNEPLTKKIDSVHEIFP